jgi:hypothetical protein
MLKLKRKISILQPTDREQGKRISKQGPTDCKRDLESPARQRRQAETKKNNGKVWPWQFRGKPGNPRRSLCSADEKNRGLAAATGDENSGGRTTPEWGKHNIKIKFTDVTIIPPLFDWNKKNYNMTHFYYRTRKWNWKVTKSFIPLGSYL